MTQLKVIDSVWAHLADYFSSGLPQFASAGALAMALDPKTVQTPALEAIDEALTWAWTTPDARLILCMPPQEGKSQRASRRFPHWALQSNPDARIALVSYEHNVARRWGRAVRDDIRDHPELGLRIRDDLSAQNEWQLDGHQGGMYTAGIAAALTGRPVDLLIIDDPVKDRKHADSVQGRQDQWDWYSEVADTRLAPGAPVVVILTRWHEDDLAGRLIAQARFRPEGNQWKVLNIPAQGMLGRPDPLAMVPGGRIEGGFLQSARGRSLEQWERIKASKDSRTWEALYQGNPTAPEGKLFRRDRWRYWTSTPPVDRTSVMIQSWDFAFKGKNTSDYVVGQVWLRTGANLYLLDQVRGQWGFSESCDQLIRLTEKWPWATTKLVEDKANGPAIMDALGGRVPGFEPVNPDGDKVARAYAIEPLHRAGNLHLPSPAGVGLGGAGADWVEGYIDEHAQFPLAVHDDQVDTTTQAVRWLAVPMLGQFGTGFYNIG